MPHPKHVKLFLNTLYIYFYRTALVGIDTETSELEYSVTFRAIDSIDAVSDAATNLLPTVKIIHATREITRTRDNRNKSDDFQYGVFYYHSLNVRVKGVVFTVIVRVSLDSSGYVRILGLPRGLSFRNFQYESFQS